MNRADLTRLHRWFDGYVASFADLDPDGLRNIRLKEVHTAHVVSCMRELAAGEGLDEQKSLLAETVALLHDVGRFPQYLRWRTFRDSISDNHARLSLEVIRAEQLLAGCSEQEQLLIEEAVRFHNLLSVPERYASSTDLYIRLIRDADKLDIWRVFLEYYQQPEELRASAVGLGFPDLPEISSDCLDALAQGQVVRLDQAKVLNDFKLLQISWVYDLNFATTRRLVSARGYLPQLAAALPDDISVQTAVSRAIASLTHIRSG